jgi:Tol biopolymer transport system component
MRFVRLIPFVLLAAGCGDNDGPGSTRKDAGPGQDSDPDDGDVEDAPPDGPPGGPARVWVVGDFLTDNRRTAGGFLTDATLPYNTTTPPPLVVPSASTTELFDGTGSTQNVFHTNGTKIAYVSNETVATRFDIMVADADGSNPVLVVQGPGLLQEITAVSISPDGTKVAYLMDGLLSDGIYDIYVAPATAGATGVKVNPDRGALPDPGQDVAVTFTWSPDSKYLAFVGDMDTLDHQELFVVDTSVSPPTRAVLLTRLEITATANPRGVSGSPLFDMQGNVFFRARIDNTDFKLYKSSPTDGTTKTLVTLPMRDDNTTPDVGAMGITPDGSKLVFSADAPILDAYDMYVADVATPGTSTKITNLTAPGNAAFTTPIAFSADNTKIAVAATFQTANNEPYVIHLDGTAMRRLVTTPCVNCDAFSLQWDPDNTTVWAIGDLAVSNDGKAYKLDSTMMDQTPTLAVDVPTGGDIVNLFVHP